MRLRGNISVFLAIILIVMVLFVGTLLDVSRMLLAKSVVKSAMQISCESLLADYDRPLREAYGIFAMAPISEEERRQIAIELMADNLTLPQGVSAIDPYGFVVKDVELLAFHNLSEPIVLKQQIAEFMKLRAPVQMVEQFVNKLAAFRLLLGEADSVEQKMAVEQLAALLRTDTVKIHVLINDFLTAINVNQHNDGTGYQDLKQAVYQITVACQAGLLQQANIYKKALSDPNQHPNTLRIALQSEQTSLSHIEGLLRETVTQQEQLVNQQKSIQGKVDALPAPRVESMQAKKEREQKIAGYQSEIAAIAIEINTVESQLALHRHSRAAQAETVASLEKQLQETIKTNTAILDELVKLLDAMKQQAVRMQNHLEKQHAYVDACILACDAVVMQSSEMQSKKNEIEQSVAERDDTVSDSVDIQVSQLIEQLEPQVYEGLKSKLGVMKTQLLLWLEPVGTYMDALENDLALCKDEKQLYTDLTGAIQPTFHAQLELSGVEGFAKLKTGLELLKRTPESINAYPIPKWTLQPPVSAEEKLVADRWVQAALGLEGEMGGAIEKEKKELQQVRQVMGQIAEDTMSFFGQNDKEVGIIIPEDTKLSLPSQNGYSSSQTTLDRIGTLGASILEQSDALYGFGELTGSTNISEHAHGFFLEVAHAIQGMAEALSQIVKSGVRGLVDGMYVNEYIISAFKNAATQNNILPYDIGWGRNLDNTYFPQGEIEYILFGHPSEKANINLAKGSVWSVRFALNLMHIYQSPEKMSTTLGLASAVAGWTLLGVPLVQNLLILGWSAAESVWDVGLLVKGNSVPLLKTAQTWHLDFKQLFMKQLQDFVWDKAENAVTDWVETGLSKADQSMRSSIQALIGNTVDSLFAAVESVTPQIDTHAVANSAATSEALIQSAAAHLMTGIRPWSSLDDFSSWLMTILKSWWAQEEAQMFAMGSAALAELKVSLKAIIYNRLINSSAYQALLGLVQSSADDFIESGFDLLKGEKKEGSVLRPSQGTRVNAVMLDTTYEDYLRLFLLFIPMDQKVKRTSDLMQLNLPEMTDDAMPMYQYKTTVWMDATIEMDSWFLLNWWQGKGRRGTMEIRMQWGQGY